MIEKDILEKIDHLVKNELSHDDAQSLLKRIKQNKDLLDRYQLAQMEHEAMNILVEEDLRKDIKEWSSEGKTNTELKPTQIRSLFTNYWRWIAASVVFVVAFSWLVWKTDAEYSQLYNKYYLPDPGTPTVMGSAQEVDFDEAMVAYKSGEYDLAIKTWSRYLVQNPQDALCIYYLASAYQASENLEEAEQYFLRLIKERDNQKYRDRAYWYLALIAVKKNRIEEAKGYLAKTKYHKSHELLKMLK